MSYGQPVSLTLCLGLWSQSPALKCNPAVNSSRKALLWSCFQHPSHFLNRAIWGTTQVSSGHWELMLPGSSTTRHWVLHSWNSVGKDTDPNQVRVNLGTEDLDCGPSLKKGSFFGKFSSSFPHVTLSSFLSFFPHWGSWCTNKYHSFLLEN